MQTGRERYLVIGILEYRIRLFTGWITHGEKPQTNPEQLFPKLPNQAKLWEAFETKQLQQKQYYDKSSTPLIHIQIGEPIRIHLTRKSAMVEEKHNDMSNRVRTLAGAQYCKNRKHLLKPRLERKMKNYFSWTQCFTLIRSGSVLESALWNSISGENTFIGMTW